MIHGAAIFAALGPLVGGRCYPVIFPQAPLPTWPAIRYSQIGGNVTPDVCGGGDGLEDDVVIQIDMVAAAYADAVALCAQVRAAMQLLSPPAVANGAARDEFDEDARVFRISQDYTLYPSSS